MPALAVVRGDWRLMLAPGPERQVHGVVGRAGARAVAGRMMAAFFGITQFLQPSRQTQTTSCEMKLRALPRKDETTCQLEA